MIKNSKMKLWKMKLMMEMKTRMTAKFDTFFVKKNDKKDHS